jgi:probable rRNA maturation factor
MDAAGLPDCELSLLVVSDRAIRKLNREFRSKDEATDVLSFSQIEEPDAPAPDPWRIANVEGAPLGDVVISINTALRQATELGISPRSRLRTLLIHGFLHLIGYDHERSAADARRMFARERALASKIARNTSVQRRAVRR